MDNPKHLSDKPTFESVNLASAHCGSSLSVKQIYYFNANAKVRFHGVTRATSAGIEVIGERQAVCKFSHLPHHFSEPCTIRKPGFYYIVYRQLESVNLSFTRFLYGAASTTLCKWPCKFRVQPSWKTVRHRVLIVPHTLSCAHHFEVSLPTFFE